MAVLQKIRVKFGIAISVIIALALLSFIIDPSTVQTALSSMSSKYDVGKIGGKSISYTDYLEYVDRYTTINEIMTGSSVQNEQTQQQIRNAAWQELIDKYLFLKNAKDAGITVGKDELVDFTSGENVSPLIANNPAFADENGVFSQEALLSFLQQIEDDQTGRLKQYWNYLQNTVYTQAYYAKYAALFTNSNFYTTLQLNSDVAQNNKQANIEYVAAYYPFTRDSSVTVSSSEVKKYYNTHKEFFKQNASREAEYVVFEVVPSADDIAKTNDDMIKAYEEFSQTDNVKSFLTRNSDRSYSEYWYKAGELSTVSKSVSDFVDANKAGAVSPIFSEGNSFFAVKVIAQTNRAENITVRVIPAKDAQSVEDVLTDLRLAEPMNMTQSYLIPGCEVLFDAKLNAPQLINTVQYGQLAAEVIEKSAPVEMKQVAILEKTTLASKETFNKYYSEANKFASITAGTSKGYLAAVDSMGVYSHKMPNVTEATASYGAIDQAKEVTRWIFDNKVGKASNIITVNNNYFFVVSVNAVHKEGYKPVAEVAAMISEKLYADKFHEKYKAELAEKTAGMQDLNAIAEALGATVSTKEGVAFSSRGGAGIEPALVGAATVAPESEVFGPVAGSAAVYFLKVLSRTESEFYTADDAKNMASQISQYNTQMILPVMMDEAEVKDNRARFF